MKIKVITSIAVKKNSKFLVLKRSEEDTMPGLWEFPGGKVETEPLKDSAIRELKEESCLTAKKIEYKGYSERFAEDRNEKSDFHTLIHHFFTDEFEGVVRLSEEHSKFMWLTKEEILKMKKGKEIGTDTVKFFKLV